MRSKCSHEYAKLFIDQIVRKIFKEKEKEENEPEELSRRPENEIENFEPLPLRDDLSDQHYS